MSELDKTIKLDRDDLQTPQVTVEAFRRLWVESGLSTEAEITQFFASLPQQLRSGSAKPLAQHAVRLGRLTRYQAQAILTGKTKALVLGSYVILDKLGQGGMGQVFRARHIKMGRVVALKVLPSSAMRTPEAIKRFQKEIQAAAKLSHPNIVTAFDAGESNRIHFLVMEYVDGQDLRAVVRERGPLPVATAVEYLLQAARGLEAAHRQGIIHRDIKPDNLLLDSSGTVKILDMGLARISDSMGEDAAFEASLTRAGQVMGTPDYMAPEQGIDTKRAESRSDIYSLGCTLHMLLLGRSPYRGETLVEKILAHRDRSIPSLMQQRSDIPESLDRLFQSMMAKRPEDRPADMSTVIEALDAILRSGVAADQIAPTVTFSAPPEAAEIPTAVSRGTLETQWPSIAVRSEGRSWTAMTRKPSLRQWVGLIATSLAGILIVVGLFALSSAIPRTGTIGLSVNPLGAQVRVLDEAGTQVLVVDQLAAPRKLELPAKRLQVTVSLDGFESYNASIEPVVGAEQSLEVRLKPLEVPKPQVPIGSVMIASNREGTAIEITEATDPDTLLHSFVSGPDTTSVDLPAGRYRISATKAGYEAYEAIVTVLENSRQRHSVVLAETPKIPEVAVNPAPSSPVAPSPMPMPMPTPMPTPTPTPASDSAAPSNPEPPTWTGWPEGTPAPAIAPFDVRTAKKHQQEWAEYLGFGKRRDNYIFTNRLGMRFVLIPPGEFVMGASAEDIALVKTSYQGVTNAFEDVEFWGPQRKVIITKPFFISAHEITLSQFDFVMQQQPGPTTALGTAPLNLKLMGELHPFKAFDFCITLAKMEDLAPAYLRDGDFVKIVGTDTYRLPTEAEWEFAARAGTTTRFWFGDDPNLLRTAERVAGSPIDGEVRAFTSPQPNAFEIYDILGNMAELTYTSFDPKFLQSPAGDLLIDPNFKADHGFYTVRGAHYATPAGAAHVAQRYGHRIPDQGPLGIRLVLDVEAARKLKEKR